MSKLFVRIGGLDYSLTAEERVDLVKSIFQPHIELDDAAVLLITDKMHGGFRNFCFVTVDAEQVQPLTEALDNTTTEEGYQLTVNEAEEKPERKPFNTRGPRNDSRGGSQGGSYGGGNGGASRRY
jgi:hypothetical protein